MVNHDLLDKLLSLSEIGRLALSDVKKLSIVFDKETIVYKKMIAVQNTIVSDWKTEFVASFFGDGFILQYLDNVPTQGVYSPTNLYGWCYTGVTCDQRLYDEDGELFKYDYRIISHGCYYVEGKSHPLYVKSWDRRWVKNSKEDMASFKKMLYTLGKSPWRKPSYNQRNGEYV